MPSLRPHERIRRRPEFQRVHEHGTRTPGRFMTAVILENSLTHARLGIVASRRLGRAVQRNRAKRLIREAFRLNKPDRAGWDVVVIPKPALLEADPGSVVSDFRSILQRNAKRSRS